MDIKDIPYLNDLFRSSLGVPALSGVIPGKLVVTPGFAGLNPDDQAAILQKVREFDTFTKDNDPYGNHDFGALDHNGQRIFWKIDLYDPDLQYGSDDPGDLTKTVRVLTILLASEW